MSLDLYQRETIDRLSSFSLASSPEPSIWDGFVRGTGLAAMRGLAATGRAIDLLGAVGPIVQDKFTGGLDAQEKYFREHEEVWQSAVDYWTPRPGEVGAAGQITGTLLSMVPMVMASPGLAIGTTQLSVGEELVQKGVSAEKAQAVGAAQAAGLGLGIWVPIFGQSLWQRLLLGGAGFNVVQGAAMRGAAELILKGTPAEGEYKTLDPQALTLDVLLGLAFGTLVHLSPAQRAQGAKFWDDMKRWGENLKPSEVDALATLRQAQHLNVDSLPGKPVDAADLDAHVQKMRTAIDQLIKGEDVNVENLPGGRFDPEPGRLEEMTKRADELVAEAEAVRVEEGLPRVEPEAQPTPRQVAPTEVEIVNPIDLAAEPSAKVRQLNVLSKENAPVVDEFLRNLDEQLGTESKSSFKEPSKILAKATRPEIIQRKPWYAVEHIRDAFRFKTVLGDITQLPQIAEAIRRQGWEVVKVDVDKIFSPKQWGWRFAAVDLRMPNGQLVEYYMPVRELEAAKKAGGHADFEAWREVDTTKLEPKRAADFHKAVERSYTRYERALEAYLQRTGQTEADLRSSAARFSEALRDMGVKPEASSAPVTGMSEGLPATKTRTLSGETTTSTSGEVFETRTKSLMGESIADFEAIRVVSEYPNLEINIGRDPDGTPQTISARQFLEDARADMEQANQDASLFGIAAGCLLGTT